MRFLLLILIIMSSVISSGCATSQSGIKLNKAQKKTGKTKASDKPAFYGKFGGKSVNIVRRNRTFEMKGVWVATVKNLDMHRHQTASTYRKEIQTIFDTISRHKATDVFFQVRSWNDALYPSRLNPWSRWLTGTEGKGISGLDPLQCTVEEAHRRKLKLHAWLNPYRVCEADATLTKRQALAQLAPDNFARKHPDYVLAVPTASPKIRLLVLDPGRPQVRSHIYQTVDEILSRYQVDGIHFDDYFYPYEPIGNLDAATQARHNKSKLPVDEWRRRNTDLLVSEVSRRVRAASSRSRRKIEFGISPFGIWANRKNHPEGSLTEGMESYYGQYADSRKWVKKGWVDYVAPQLYWNFKSQAAAFAGLVEWWVAQTKGTKVKLYIGIALYQGAPGGPWAKTNELANQIEFIKGYSQVNGFLLFRSAFLDQATYQLNP